VTKFIDLILPEPLLRAAAELKYYNPTPIQELCIPWLLENAGDLIAVAQTGTGKTAAFGFPILNHTNIELAAVQTLILCPTRELCLQIHSDFTDFTRYMPRIKLAAVYGGASMQKQKDALKAGAQIVAGTPGRVYDLIRQNLLKLEQLTCLVLDEADEMLNMGFQEELFAILSCCPEARQTLLFSATMPQTVVKLADTFLKEPHQIGVADQQQGVGNILHYYYKVHARDKYLALKRIADMNPNIYGIIFCRTRHETQEIADKLQQDGYNADALHGDLSQGQRELVMNRFRSKYVRLLVATDVAARGLDVDDLSHIINYNLPTEPDLYIHRSGRTGRAGKKGISLSIIHSKEMTALQAIERRLGREIVFTRVPGGREICEKQLYNFIDMVERIEVDQEQIDSFLPNVYKKLSWMSREELIQRFVSVEFNRFLSYYKNLNDLDVVTDGAKKADKSTFQFKTFRLGIGKADAVTKREIMRYINQLRVTRSIEIGQIEIYDKHLLIELDSTYEYQLLKAIPRVKFKGKAISISSVESSLSRKSKSAYKGRKSR